MPHTLGTDGKADGGPDHVDYVAARVKSGIVDRGKSRGNQIDVGTVHLRCRRRA